MPQKSMKLFLFILLLVACSGQIASDIYSPSLPAIASHLNASLKQVQWTMAIYLFGLSISQLFYGPLSEGIGRRKPLLLGLVIMLFGSLVCFFATNIHMLILGRLIQGCGAGACAALWRSMFRDLFSGPELAKYGSYLAIFVTFIIPAAPMIGGYLQHYFGWRANFSFLACYIIINILLVYFALQETSQHHHKDRLALTCIIESYKQLFTNPVFIGYTLCSFISYGAFFTWFTIGPIILIGKAGMSPVAFGWTVFLGNGLAMALAGRLNGKYIHQVGEKKMLQLGWSIMGLSGCLIILGYFLFGVNMYAILIPSILFNFGVTFIWPNVFAGAFNPFAKMAGYAGAGYGFLQISGGAVVGFLMSHLPTNNQIPLGMAFILSPIIAISFYQLVVQKLVNPIV